MKVLFKNSPFINLISKSLQIIEIESKVLDKPIKQSIHKTKSWLKLWSYISLNIDSKSIDIKSYTNNTSKSKWNYEFKAIRIKTNITFIITLDK